MASSTRPADLNVADHDLAVAWHSDLMGGEADRRPMEPMQDLQR
jgi:hypothetical protein